MSDFDEPIIKALTDLDSIFLRMADEAALIMSMVGAKLYDKRMLKTMRYFAVLNGAKGTKAQFRAVRRAQRIREKGR